MKENNDYGLSGVLTDTNYLLARTVAYNLAVEIVNIFLKEYPLKDLQKLQKLFNNYSNETTKLFEEIKNNGK